MYYKGMKTKRDNALQRAAERTDSRQYNDDREKHPDDDRNCIAYATDGIGDPYPLPFPVLRKAGQWLNANHGKPIAVKIVKWRYA